jgi:hypothetical protein
MFLDIIHRLVFCLKSRRVYIYLDHILYPFFSIECCGVTGHDYMEPLVVMSNMRVHSRVSTGTGEVCLKHHSVRMLRSVNVCAMRTRYILITFLQIIGLRGLYLF